jgi:hypothetical protein
MSPTDRNGVCGGDIGTKTIKNLRNVFTSELTLILSNFFNKIPLIFSGKEYI